MKRAEKRFLPAAVPRGERIFHTAKMKQRFAEADRWFREHPPRPPMTLEEMLAAIPEGGVPMDRAWENVEPVDREAWSKESLEAEAGAMGNGSTQATPADGNIFADLGFPADEAERMLEESNRRARNQKKGD